MYHFWYVVRALGAIMLLVFAGLMILTILGVDVGLL